MLHRICLAAETGRHIGENGVHRSARSGGGLNPAQELIQPGVLRAEKLVNLARHDYSLEPNVTFTPDGRWIVFRSNLFGPVHVFAVEVEKR
jgi:hypothetical protein